MATYIYRARKSPTEIVSGQLDADNEDQALSRLKDELLYPISISLKSETPAGFKKSSPAGAWHLFRSSGVKAPDVDIFTRQLSSLLKSGVPILRALSLIAGETDKASFKSVVEEIARQVKDGRSFSQAVAAFPGIFNGLYLSMIKAGETGGVLDETLFKLAEYRQKESDIRSKIQASLAYPVFMILAGVGTVFIMLTFFLPKFVSLFKDMKQALPLPTRIVMDVSSFMSQNWYWLVIAAVFLASLFARRRRGAKKLLIDMAVLHIPLIKRYALYTETAKFSRTLGLLLKNGISVHAALECATGTIDNDILRGKLSQAGQEIVSHGSTLSLSLRKAGVFHGFVINMISVGEESGKLDDALAEIANVYEREVDQAVRMIMSVLEPALILLVGSMVGFIVFAMLLPIFNIGTMVK